MQSKTNKDGIIFPDQGIEIVDNGKRVVFLIHDNDKFLKAVPNRDLYLQRCKVCQTYQYVPCIERLFAEKQTTQRISDYKLSLKYKYCPKTCDDRPMWMA